MRHDFSEQLQTLGDQLRALKACSSYIRAWPCKAGNQSILDGIGPPDFDDGNEAGGLSNRSGRRRTLFYYDINVAFNHLSSDFVEKIRV